MTKIVFATHNQNKVLEIQSLCGKALEIVPLSALGFSGEIPETQPTIEGNAMQKAQFVFEKFHLPCFAEDTGLEVEALNGAPGVKTARYAGEGASADENISKLLGELYNKTNRAARFKTVIAYMDAFNNKKLFVGTCCGQILHNKTGIGGFGYDPVFRPDGSEKSFAEMNLQEKNLFSHRAKAFAKFVEYLKDINL